MYAYRTPRVVFEWRDTRARDIDVLRTDSAGFVGVAERGPLHRPLKVESWTQFSSLFGGHVAQGYLAYAVEAFFANGGQTCWVVRVADPDHARPARLVLRDSRGRPALELTAANRHQEGGEAVSSRSLSGGLEARAWLDPGTWAHQVTATVSRGGRGPGRFTLILRLRGGAPEIWRDLSMVSDDPLGRFVEAVLNDPGGGSRLVRARCLRPRGQADPEATPSPQAPNLFHGVGRLAGGQDGLAPAVMLRDDHGAPRLRLVARVPTLPGTLIKAMVEPGDDDRFTLRVAERADGEPFERPDSQDEERFENLTLRPPYLDLQDRDGRATLRLAARSPEQAQIEVVVAPMGGGRFGLNLRTVDGRLRERWPRGDDAGNPGLSMDPADAHYVEKVINGADGGSFLVSAADLAGDSPVRPGPPAPDAPNLWQGVGRLGYGPPRLLIADTAGRPALRLRALNHGGAGIGVSVTAAAGGGASFGLALQPPDSGAPERWPDLSLQPDSPRYVERVLNSGAEASRLVRAEVLREGAALDVARAGSAVWAADRVYAPERLNDPRPGSRLVAATDPGGESLLAAASPVYGLPFLELRDYAGRVVMRLEALRPIGRRGITVAIPSSDPGGKRFSLSLADYGAEERTWADLSMDPSDARFVECVLNSGKTASQLVRARVTKTSDSAIMNPPDAHQAERARWLEPPQIAGGPSALAGGLGRTHFDRPTGPSSAALGLSTLEPIDEVSIVAMPDLMPKLWARPEPRAEREECGDLRAEPAPPPLVETPPEQTPRLADTAILALQQAMIAHCESLKDRIAIIDPPIDQVHPDSVLRWRADSFKTASSYAALYYPWVMVRDPLRDGQLLAVPPCGHVAGVYARVDRRDGVHRPPANELLHGVLDIAPHYAERLRSPAVLMRGRPSVKDVQAGIDDAAHGLLNDHQINVIRPYPGRGVRIMGERVLEAGGEIRYVNVRRLLMMIAEAIDERTQWTVFEPNNPMLWLDIERVVASFLTTLWQRGMLDGATMADAFMVRCDASTNPPEETAQGRVICYIGVQPPWPAEFVIVRIGKTESGVVVLEGSRI